MTFSLLDSPFVRLSATSKTRPDELSERALDDGSPEAAAALGVLLAPRTRLPAELAFLPGEAARAASIITALRNSEQPETFGLTGQAAANVLAHLCAAGGARPKPLRALVGAQVERGSPALLKTIAADRLAAELPPPQLAMLVAAQDHLADIHALALVDACLATAEPAELLKTLMVERTTSPSQATLPFLRRVALVWSRETAGLAGEVEGHVSRAEAKLKASPTPATTEMFVAAVKNWANLSAPERLIDAQYGLDHEPSAAKAKRWSGIASELEAAYHYGLALQVAETLLATLGDLPGFANLLRRDRDASAARARDRVYDAAFQPLRALITEIENGPLGFVADVAASGFGPSAVGQSALMWRAFDDARSAASISETPLLLVSTFADVLETRLDAPATALVVVQALLELVSGSNSNEQVVQLRAQERRLLRKIGLKRLPALSRRWIDSLKAIQTVRELLALSDDPALTQQLAATRRRIERRVATISSGVFIAAALIVLAIIGVTRSIVSGPKASDAAKIASGVAKSAPSDRDVATPSTMSSNSTPGALPPSAPREGLASADAPAAPPVSGDATVPSIPLDLHFDDTTPSESKPEDTNHVFSLLEVRWCKFNQLRLTAMRTELAAQSQARKDAFNLFARPWDELCRDYPARQHDATLTYQELKTYHQALLLQAGQMLRQIDEDVR